MRSVSGLSTGKRVGLIMGGMLLAFVVGVLICEAIGWPFLVGPLQGKLASTLDRKVDFGADNAAVKIRLLGSVRIRAPRIEIGAPSWSSTPHTFLADGVALKLTYGDLWRAYRTGTLRIDALEAERFDTQLERLADGRASWEFKPHQPSATGSVTDLPTFGRLRVAAGSLTLLDAKTPLDLDARYSLSDGTIAKRTSSASSASIPTAGSDAAVHGLHLTASGHYKKSPLKIAAETDGVLILEGAGGAAGRQPLRLDATIGTAKMSFTGAVTDPLHLTRLQGHFKAAGPSLDAAGEPLGVTLPVTPIFNMAGSVVKDGTVWKAVFDHADIGSSKLSGAFTFDKQGKVPLLSGKLQGMRLALGDLGPAIGHAQQIAGAASAPEAQGRPGRIIPDHSFDLPSLRVMNANVLFDIDVLDLGTKLLEPLRPARAHLTLDNGVLTLADLDARTAQGELFGMAALDGRSNPAIWATDLHLRNLQLNQWLHQKRGEGDPPYISGKLDGQVKVNGTGRSVAEILGSLNGGARFHMADATLSHLALKAAGLDVAGGVKVLLSGDAALAVHCNVADLVVASGVVRPKVFVVSLDNATIWADGQVSLADETLNVRAVSSPKDFSPLSLRTPIDVKGTLSKPAVSIEASGPMARGGAALLLGLLNPLAAVVPFLDPGSRDAAKKEDSECAALVKRAGTH
jgi:uncharacterized protein involved in outer membrane biogenesis